MLILGAAMTRPGLRLPALVVGLLSIPGNVDNYVPQMQMDLHAVANNTGPAISVIDGLLLWAVVLTAREGRRAWPPALNRRFIIGAVIVAAIAIVACLTAVVTLGVEPLAAVRGMLTFARIPALIYLAVALLPLDPAGLRLSIAAAIGGVVLLGNGIYTSGVQSQARFTATTFGRNGLGMVLVLVSLLAAGVVVHALRDRIDRRWAVPVGFLAAAALFGAMATGTRMSLIALIVGMVGAIVLNRTWHSRVGALQVAGAVLLAVLVVVGSTFASAAGGRSVSTVTDIGETIDTVSDFKDLSEYSEVRTRSEFWSQAITIAKAHPLTGAGPYQWNILRYGLDAKAPELVANPHNTYVQIAAEFGLPALIAYLALLVAVLVIVAATQLRSGSTTARSWTAALVVACAVAYPITELTNSHLFNVRLGAFGWVLLATALAMALADRAERRRTATELVPR